MGAPNGNLNAVKNGRSLRPLKLGELPKQLERVTRDVRRYRRYLETHVQERHGEISEEHHHIIDEAAANEVHAAVCRWLLRNKIDDMDPNDVLACSRDIPRAKAARNKAVLQLQLTIQPRDIFDALYSVKENAPVNDDPAPTFNPTSEETIAVGRCRADAG